MYGVALGTAFAGSVIDYELERHGHKAGRMVPWIVLGVITGAYKMPTGPNITLARKSGAVALMKRVAGISKLAAYVGIPAADKRERETQLLGMAGKTKSKYRKARLQKAAANDVTNAELLFIFSKGSPLRHQPARPVLEPACAADGNRQPIERELAGSVKASLAGDHEAATKKMKRAALAGQNAARGWFTDSRNNWAPNAASTVAAKLRHLSPSQREAALDKIEKQGGDTIGVVTPGIDTGAMRAAIIGVVREE